MFTTKDVTVTVQGVMHKKHILLADVNIPYKFSIDRRRNNLIFCINADEFSDQSFHSVVLNVDTGVATIVPGIRNGFASAVNQNTGEVFLGGSDGIYRFDYDISNITGPPLVGGIDIFDMYHHTDLYFVDTFTQTLHIYKGESNRIVPNLKGHLINHFVIDGNNDLFFMNPSGLFILPHGSSSPILLDDGTAHYRGAAIDANGTAHFITNDGIYTTEKQTRQLQNILPIEDGYGLAFDTNNNIIYGNERSVIKLVHY